ncbi:hypothetical protein JTB14_031178 [Gonioctena quinquepunctata]|nr:hypothetical protein JTB14_031178 [Gonioctena quinquepunctata]
MLSKQLKNQTVGVKLLQINLEYHEQLCSVESRNIGKLGISSLPRRSAKDHANKNIGGKRRQNCNFDESPYKNELLEAIEASETKELNAEATKRKIISSGNENKPKGKQKLKLEQNKSTKSDEEDSDEVLMWNVCIAGI